MFRSNWATFTTGSIQKSRKKLEISTSDQPRANSMKQLIFFRDYEVGSKVKIAQYDPNINGFE